MKSKKSVKKIVSCVNKRNKNLRRRSGSIESGVKSRLNVVPSSLIFMLLLTPNKFRRWIFFSLLLHQVVRERRNLRTKDKLQNWRRKEKITEYLKQKLVRKKYLFNQNIINSQKKYTSNY